MICNGHRWEEILNYNMKQIKGFMKAIEIRNNLKDQKDFELYWTSASQSQEAIEKMRDILKKNTDEEKFNSSKGKETINTLKQLGVIQNA